MVAGARRTEALANLPGVTPVAIDLTPPEAPAELVSGRSTSTGGSTCSSTTSARREMRLDGFLATSDEEFEWAMQMNFFIALRATRAALRAMVERRARERSSTSPR